MEIRRILDDDRDAWKRLFTAYGLFYSKSFDDDLLHKVWAWLTDDDNPVNALVAVDDGVVVAFAHYTRLMDTFTAGPKWYLDDLFVEPYARGKGVATALIAAVEAHARTNGSGKIRWITATDNDTAQHVYDRVATKTSWVTYEKELG